MKKNQKTKMFGLMSAAALALGVQQAGAANVAVTNDVSVNTTWSSNNVYKMDRMIIVKNGATLTIQPGTLIRGLPGTSCPGTLLIARGSKINANGTAEAPIVFTDQYDDNFGPNPGSTNNPAGYNYGKLNNQVTGQWGGLILAGASYIAWDGMESSGVYSPDASIETAIEGLTGVNDINYGGGNDLDNSGTLNYVSSRYGGYVLAPSKEINGFTFCGVGRGTKLDHLDVYNTKDDNVEFFGGTANMKHLVTWNGTDDGIDTDTGWRGKIQFALVVQGVSTICGPAQAPDCADKGLEWDGAGDVTGFNSDPASAGSMFNFTLIGNGNSNCTDRANTAFNIRDNAGARLYNGIVMDFAGGCTLIEGSTNPAEFGWGTSCSAMKLYQDYAQDSYFTSKTNKQGATLTIPAAKLNYIGYPDVIAGSKKVEFKKIAFWNMGIPHSIGLATNLTDVTAAKVYLGSDGSNTKFWSRPFFGTYPNDSGYDIVAVGNAGGNYIAADMPIQTYERDDANVYTFKASFRTAANSYTCVKTLDPRANTNLLTKGIMPPADGFYTPVNFLGAMGKKNWAGPWSTPWRLGGFVTNGVPTGDDTGIVPTISKTGSGSAGKVKIKLSTDTYLNTPADFWIIAVKGTALRWYDLTGTGKWQSTHSGLWPTYAGGLIDIPTDFALNMATLPTGTWTIYWGVDLKMNNTLDMDSLSVTTINYTR